MPRETSAYSTSLIIKYCIEKGIDLNTLFNGIEDKKHLLENPNEWIDIATLIQFTKNFEAAGGNLFQTGIEITERQVSHFQLMLLKVAPLRFIISDYSKHFEKKISPLINLSFEIKGNGVLDTIFTPKDKSKYSAQICDFNRGCAIATGNLKRLRNFKITEITCAARSDAPECRYRWTWTPDPPIFERIKNFLLFRFTSQKAIFAHMEETYNRLQDQYHEILGIKDFYSHIMSSMKEGILWLDGSGRVSFVNSGFCSIIKAAGPEAVIGNDFKEFLANDPMRVIMSEILVSCREKPKVPEVFELSYTASSGNDRIGQTTCLWVDSTAQQKPGYLLSIRDITDKRTIERKLYAEENRYRSLYENSPAIIIGVDNDGNIIYANPAMEEQSGYTEKELVTMHFSDLVVPSGSTMDAKALLAQRIGKVGLQEMHYRTKAGEWKSVALATFPLYGDKWEVIGLGAIGIDVTETKKLNELLIQTQRMDLLGQMAGGLAHDFKNLLAVISGYGKLIGEISSEDKIKEFAHNIMLANERAYNLTKNLLMFSRGESVKSQQFVLNEVFEEVKKLLPALLGRTIRFTMELPEERFIVSGDPGKIHQCLLNLCVNARDAIADKCGGRLTVRLARDTNPDWATIEVEDNGPGIRPDIITRIFDPFFTTKKKGDGTGLGLSVVYGIVKSHNGDISVDSRPGDGTTFTMRLPLHVTERGLTRSGGEDEGQQVIVVDSDAVSRNYCAQILTRHGYAVVQLSSIQESLQWIGRHPAPAVLIFTASNAKEAAQVKTKYPDMAMLAIAETSANTAELPCPHLSRPFPPAALIETVRETVQRKYQV